MNKRSAILKARRVLYAPLSLCKALDAPVPVIAAVMKTINRIDRHMLDLLKRLPI